MISQNWFSNKNFIMFNEYYEIYENYLESRNCPEL